MKGRVAIRVKGCVAICVKGCVAICVKGCVAIRVNGCVAIRSPTFYKQDAYPLESLQVVMSVEQRPA